MVIAFWRPYDVARVQLPIKLLPAPSHLHGPAGFSPNWIHNVCRIAVLTEIPR